MKKTHTKYVCQSCAYETTRWLGKCPNCDEWNSFVEERMVREPSAQRAVRGAAVPVPVRMSEVRTDVEPRQSSGIPEFDRVLGGGVVPGSVVLVGGDPGIGKSTLMMQMACILSHKAVLYITGEESVTQIKLRAARLELPTPGNLFLLGETNLEAIEAAMDSSKPDLVVVDSIQTMYNPGLESAPGTISQVRDATAFFMRFAKSRNTPTFLVGHVTKEGIIAGPRVIEHMVDTVLQFEGERHYSYRILRAMKNRFGSTNEIGIFEMHDGGLQEVENPSQVLLSQRRYGTSGSTVVAGLEGTRPLLLEIQALVARTSYGLPQRTATGFDSRRLQMLLAVLEKRVGIRVGEHDVFVNVAGGVRIEEPAADLGTAISIVSSLRDIPVDQETVVVGEVGLGGEIRRISQAEKRLVEAKKLGFRRIVVPSQNLPESRRDGDIQLLEVDTIDQAIDALIGGPAGQ